MFESLKSVLSTIAHAAADEAVLAAIPRLESARWTVLQLPSGAPVYGLVLGRRFVKTTGILGLLCLQPSGIFKFHVVPYEGDVPYVEEEVVRGGCVWANRRTFIPRGHPFEESPIVSTLCSVCAQVEETHHRERLLVAIEAAVDSDHVDVEFDGDSMRVVNITIYPPPPQPKPRMNPLPGEDPLLSPQLLELGEPKPEPRRLDPEQIRLVLESAYTMMRPK